MSVNKSKVKRSGMPKGNISQLRTRPKVKSPIQDNAHKYGKGIPQKVAKLTKPSSPAEKYGNSGDQSGKGRGY